MKSLKRCFWLDTLLTMLAPICWGSVYLVTVALLPPDRPFIAALIRTLPAGIVLLLFSRHLPKKGEWGKLLLLTALNMALFQSMMFLAAYRLPGGVAAIFAAFQPLLIMGLVWLVDKRRPGYLAVIACLFSLVGMAVLLLSPSTQWDMVGIFAAIIGALSMALGLFLSRHYSIQLPTVAFTGWQLLLGGIMLIPIAWIIDDPLTILTRNNLLGYLYLSVFASMIAYSLWFRGLARLPTVAVSSLGLLSPITAVILGWYFLGQSFNTNGLIGLVMVLVGILIVQLVSQTKR